MKFYEWRLVGRGGFWENHVFPGSFCHPDHFTSLCGERFGALNGSSKQAPYCPTCRVRLPISEVEAQSQEDERLSKREAELAHKRPGALKEIHRLLEAMPTDRLLEYLRDLKK